MTLSIVGPQSIAKLKEYVNDAFKSVPNKNRMEKPEEKWRGVLPYSYGVDSLIPSLGNVVEIEPVQDLR